MANQQNLNVMCKDNVNNPDRIFSEISDTLVIAYQNYDIWWLYKNEREKYVNIMNNYLSFFTNSISAHFVAMLMAISCLVDDKYLSIKSLYKKLKKVNLSVQDVSLIENEFKNLEYIIKGVRIIRSNVFAHKSDKIESNEAFSKANLKYDDIKKLLFGLGEIYNTMCKATNRSILGFWINSTKPDTERLLSDLINYNKKKTKRNLDY